MRRLSLVTALPIALLGGLLATSGVAKEPRTQRPSDEERGKELYDRHCEACHGAWAKGHGPATQALVHKVPDLEGKVVASEETIGLVLRGKGAMPAYEQSFDRFDARRVLEHMSTLKKPAPGDTPPAAPAKEAPAEEPGPAEEVQDEGAPPE